MNVLILNVDSQPYAIWSWQKTMKKLLCSKSIVPLAYYDRTIRDGKGNIYRVPSVVILKKYMPSHKPASYSKSNVYSRDMLICQYCGVKTEKGNRTIDHVIPKAQYNGKIHKFKLNSFENVVTCCQRCNELKGNKTPKQASMELINIPKRITMAEVYRNKLRLIRINEDWKEYIYNVEEKKSH